MALISGKKIIVTGGAGFIGSHLCEALCEKNDVISIDDYSSGSKKNHVKKVKYFNGQSKDIKRISKQFSPDLIFHFGEYSRVETSFDDYDIVVEKNLESFRQILNFAKNNNSKLIYSGSSTKFASYDEGDSMSPYAWVKSKNTEHLQNYSLWFGLDYAIVYFYNVFGGNEIAKGKFSTVIAKYKKLYSEGKRKLPLVKPGSQLRNFTHFSDVINGLMIVAKKGEGDGYGIGSERSISMIEIVNFFNCEPEYIPSRKGNRLSASLNTESTKALGWRSKVDVEDHIKRFISN